MDKSTKLLFFFAVIAVLFTFWPGKYHYYTPEGFLVRVNRFTDQTEYYTTNAGWTTAKPGPDTLGRPAQTPSPGQGDLSGKTLVQPTPKPSPKPSPKQTPKPTPQQ
jgi:hypothetical protein